MRTSVRRLLVLLAIPAATLVLAAPSQAAWDPDPTTGARLVAGGTQDQFVRAAVTDNAGGAIVIYTDYFLFTGYRLMAARIDANGNFQWSVALSPGQFYETPACIAAPDGAGGAVITYRETRGAGYVVYGQRVNSAGGNLWASGGPALTSVSAGQYMGGVVPDGAGGLIAGWCDNRGGTLDVYAQRIVAAGTVAWGTGLVVCTAAADQYALNLCTDGASGAIVSWDDTRAGGGDLFAARVTSGGALPWTANGVQVSNGQRFTSAYTSDYRGIASDGSGGAVFGWTDSRLSASFKSEVFVERLNANGLASWGGGGHAVTSVNTDMADLHVVPDNKGGAFLGWIDARTGIYLPYTQRVDAAGGPRWPGSGVLATTNTTQQTVYFDAIPDGQGGMINSWSTYRGTGATLNAQRFNVNGAMLWGPAAALVEDGSNAQQFSRLVPDGLGGTVVAFYDTHPAQGGGYDVRAQRIERFGMRAEPAPAIARIRDVSADQGGHLALDWSASYLDIQSDPQIADYTLWRRVPTASAQAALARGARVDQPLEAGASAPQLRTSGFGAQTLFWEYTGLVNARALPGYSAVMATTTDSLPGSNPRTSFMVAAETAGGAKWWFSAPDSGYSVDNIPPGSPGPFTGAFVAGATHLHWLPNAEPDLAGYRVYRGTSSSFPADGAHLVASPPDTGYVDAAGTPYYYKLTAIDAHGNESAAALLTPNSTLDAPAVVTELALAAPWPNPVRGYGTLRFALPSPGRASLALFDAQGRLVRTLANGEFPAGEHSVRVEIRDAAGRTLEPGLYFARLTSALGERVTRFVIVE